MARLRRGRSVDLHLPAADLLDLARLRADVHAAQDHLPVPPQRERGLAAAEHDLLAPLDLHAPAVDARLARALDRRGEQRDQDRPARVALLEEEHRAAPVARGLLERTALERGGEPGLDRTAA